MRARSMTICTYIKSGSDACQESYSTSMSITSMSMTKV